MNSKLYDVLDKVLSVQLDRQYGRGFFKISSVWHNIVGNELRDFSSPRRIVYDAKNLGTLQIKVQSGAVALQIFYKKQQILQEIAFLFGYQIVSDLKTVLS